jgi:hypothetical protein
MTNYLCDVCIGFFVPDFFFPQNPQQKLHHHLAVVLPRQTSIFNAYRGKVPAFEDNLFYLAEFFHLLLNNVSSELHKL